MALNIKGDRSLYWSTGLDLNGLKAGAAGAKGILGKLTANVSTMDIFAGVGASAAIAFGTAAKKAYSFSKDFQTAMKEVQTISAAVRQNYDGISREIVNMSKRVSDSSVDLTKAYYQTVSAGYDGAQGLKVLEEAAKAAMGGVTDTTTAVDGITTVLNSFKMGADKASKVADIMFTTVRLGKTNFEELSGRIATVSSIAAANKVEFEELSAAIATMTKQGVPTAEAMTQIRQSIIAMNEVLGDGWAETMTFQEGLQQVANKAGGSMNELRRLVGSVEAMNVVLNLTGENLAGANADLEAHRNSLGEAEKAYRVMRDSAENQLSIMGNNIAAKLKPIG
ncbi:MAG: phage tail tape measure protein, partial [Smithella sp.]|nr:phage tail tape measure protein [Smithella sp.]